MVLVLVLVKVLVLVMVMVLFMVLVSEWVADGQRTGMELPGQLIATNLITILLLTTTQYWNKKKQISRKWDLNWCFHEKSPRASISRGCVSRDNWEDLPHQSWTHKKRWLKIFLKEINDMYSRGNRCLACCYHYVQSFPVQTPPNHVYRKHICGKTRYMIFLIILEPLWRENTNLYRELIKVVQHYIKRFYNRSRRLYRVSHEYGWWAIK